MKVDFKYFSNVPSFNFCVVQRDWNGDNICDVSFIVKYTNEKMMQEEEEEEEEVMGRERYSKKNEGKEGGCEQ